MPETRRIAQIVKIRSEALQAYKDCHAAVWPAVLEQIKDCNIFDYSIFYDDTSSTLFATMKWSGQDFEADMERMRANPEVQRWWKMTDGEHVMTSGKTGVLLTFGKGMQQSLVDGSNGSTDPKGWWKELEEVFRCE